VLFNYAVICKDYIAQVMDGWKDEYGTLA